MRFRSYTLEIFILLPFFLYSFHAGEKSGGNDVNRKAPFINIPSPWADSLIKKLSDEEKIAQLFMVAAYSNRNGEHIDEITKLVERYGIGGLAFFQGGPVRQAIMCNNLQRISKVPLMIGMDAEWGLAMRLDSTVKYPWQMTIAAGGDDKLVFEMGRQIGEQMNRLGVHVNFAPVVDINVNPDNPVISARSFGQNKSKVASAGIAYMKGMQSMKVLGTAKHFPGHGDTESDSHFSLPIIDHNYKRLDSVEMHPFRQLIANGLGGVMVAHLYIPALVKEKNLASTLAPEIVNGLLKDSMDFSGLVFTDALNMKGVTSYYKAAEADLRALLAGNDVLLLSEDVPGAIDLIKSAVKDGLITMDEIESRCLKILRAKEWMGLSDYKEIQVEKLYEDLNKLQYQLLSRKMYSQAITVLSNRDKVLPLMGLDTSKIALLSIGDGDFRPFHYYLSMYAGIDTFRTAFTTTVTERTQLLDRLKDYDIVIAGIHSGDASPYAKVKIDGSTSDLLHALKPGRKVVLTPFCNPYALSKIAMLNQFDALVLAYQNNEFANEAAAKVIFGGSPAGGRLPVTIDAVFRHGAGLDAAEVIRLNYVWPEDIGIDRMWLSDIDSIVMEGLLEQAYPGCQVLAAKDGKVFYQRSFGFHTYDSLHPVRTEDIYDLASITKIAATLPGIMKLDEENKIRLDYALCDYMPDWLDTTDYANLNLREILAHQAGLVPWVAFYKKSMVKGSPRYDVYSLDSSGLYNRRVAENLFINKTYRDSMWAEIMATPVQLSGEYKYSDLGYYFFQEILENHFGIPLDEYASRTLYSPMGMNRTTFRPLRRFSKNEIIPTENDKVFRRQLIHGHVHDPGSAMMGGVGGHAGLFSNANDMAKLMQMYLNGGTYGGQRYFNDSIIMEYTSCQYCEDGNRRGVGFDKPMPDGSEGGPSCTCASFLSFGHSGFSGTYVWADPVDNISFIFLSNRIHPDTENKKLTVLGTRTRIQKVIYDAISRSKGTAIASPFEKITE